VILKPHYVEAGNKLKETLGERQGWLYFYNGNERAASDVDCIVTSWNSNGISVLLAYNQTDTIVSAYTQITAHK
jgi:hypothetical protein